MRLSNKFIVQMPYKGKTKFQFWSDLKVGDILTISFEIGKYSDVNFSCDTNEIGIFTTYLGMADKYINQIILKRID